MENKKKVYRYEIKMIVNNINYNNFLSSLKLKLYNFSEVYNSRKISNIYFDSKKLDSFYQNKGGLLEKEKIRIRWYDISSNNSLKPHLEFKIKTGQLGYKVRYKIKKINFHNSINKSDLLTLIDEINMPLRKKNKVKKMIPYFVNTYNRKYFLSKDNKIRMTIDSSLCYYNIKNLSCPLRKRGLIVVEFKFDENNYNAFIDIANKLPYRYSTFSKFVLGIESIYLKNSNFNRDVKI